MKASQRIDNHIQNINIHEDIPFGWLVSDRNKFNFTQDEFIKYLELFIGELFKNGGKVVGGSKKNNTEYEWVETNEFGKKPNEIANNLFKAYESFINSNSKSDEYLFTYNVWFAKPDPDNKFVKTLDN